MLKYCPSCYTETEVPEEETICPHCGEKLDTPFTEEEDEEILEMLMTLIQA